MKRDNRNYTIFEFLLSLLNRKVFSKTPTHHLLQFYIAWKTKVTGWILPLASSCIKILLNLLNYKMSDLKQVKDAIFLYSLTSHILLKFSKSVCE